MQSSSSNLCCAFILPDSSVPLSCGYITVLPLQASRLSADGGRVCSGLAGAQCLRSCTQPARDAPPPAPHGASTASGAFAAGCEPVSATEAIPCLVASTGPTAGAAGADWAPPSAAIPLLPPLQPQHGPATSALAQPPLQKRPRRLCGKAPPAARAAGNDHASARDAPEPPRQVRSASSLARRFNF